MADGIDRNELLELFRGEAEEYLATLNERLPRLGRATARVWWRSVFGSPTP